MDKEGTIHPVLFRDKMTKILENNPDLARKRSAFIEAWNEISHQEATAYSYWALEAFDIANGLR